jgi:acyl-CoA thioester hydrolase
MRWIDQDPFGHVNNTIYLVYLEQARVDLFFRLGALYGVDSLARGVVIVRTEIDYLKPVVYRNDPLRIEMWCDDVRAASFSVRYEIFDGTEVEAPLAARARSRCAPFDLAAGRPRRLADAERAFVQQFTDPMAAA